MIRIIGEITEKLVEYNFFDFNHVCGANVQTQRSVYFALLKFIEDKKEIKSNACQICKILPKLVHS